VVAAAVARHRHKCATHLFMPTNVRVGLHMVFQFEVHRRQVYFQNFWGLSGFLGPKSQIEPSQNLFSFR